MASLFKPSDIVSRYTRAQAIADRVLIDVSAIAAEAGFSIPVAVTAAVWSDCVAWSHADNDRKGTVQDIEGRLWDVVYMARRVQTPAGGDAPFTVYRVPRPRLARAPRPASLVLRIGPGDDGKPVATITMPNER